MSALVLAPLRNVPGKRDADEFAREARAFCKLHGYPAVAIFNNSNDLAERRADVLRHLHALEPGSLSMLALFCHGWPDGVQAGFRSEHVRGFARELKAVAAPELTVALYCCSTGADLRADTDETHEPGPGGDGGFADRLRDELCELGVAATVFAHSTAGHTTRNPRVRVFTPAERAGGGWLVEPRGELWTAWLRALHDSDMRLRFPLLTAEQLAAELRS